MKTILILFMVVWGIGLMISCQTDDSPDPDAGNTDTGNNGKNINDTFTPDELSEFLVLEDATRIEGDLPSAMDGQIKMDVKDTIFVVNGHPLGDRIRFRHDPDVDIAGFYIQVDGASFYYDVGKEIIEDQYVPTEENDTLSVFKLDLDLNSTPSNGRFRSTLGTSRITDNNYSGSLLTTIQPYDLTGMPLDEFVKHIKVEDPGNCPSICNSTGTGSLGWQWEFTVREMNGEILKVWAPGIAERINTHGWGCCNDNGTSSTVASNPNCYENTTAPRLTWVELEVDDYRVRNYEFLKCWDYGDFFTQAEEIIKQYYPSLTNFCSGNIGYTFSGNNDPQFGGTHDFTPGSDHINIRWTNWTGGSWMPDGGDIVYTCNTLLISEEETWGDGEYDRITQVYKRFENNDELMLFAEMNDQWYD